LRKKYKGLVAFSERTIGIQNDLRVSKLKDLSVLGFEN